MLAALALAVAGCEQPNLAVPSAAEVESYYSISAPMSVELSGNVAEIEITQPWQQLERGGELWAKVGPYIYLFSEETQSLFADYGGLAGVRVVTKTPGGSQVAEALLSRDELNDITWKNARAVAARARIEGSRRVRRIEELIQFGEDHTEFTYDPSWVVGS